MDEQDRFRELRLKMLRRDIQKGLDSGPGEAWDPEAMKKEALAEWSSTKKGTKDWENR